MVVGGAVCIPRAGVRVVITARTGTPDTTPLQELSWPEADGVITVAQRTTVTPEAEAPDAVLFGIQVGNTTLSLVIPLDALDHVRVRT